jgi:hypothetical protein
MGMARSLVISLRWPPAVIHEGARFVEYAICAQHARHPAGRCVRHLFLEGLHTLTRERRRPPPWAAGMGIVPLRWQTRVKVQEPRPRARYGRVLTAHTLVPISAGGG